MARKPATLQLSSNIEGNFSAPLDGRMKVADLEELTAEGSFPFPYRGLLTYVESEQKWYTLRYDDPTNISSWAEMTQGADGRDGLDVGIDSVSKVGRENTVTFVWKDPDGSDKTRDMIVMDGMQGERGETGPAGPQGPAGRSFSLGSQYDSYAELIAEHPTGEEGDAYFVTSEIEGNPPDVYVWLSESNEWFNNGPILGMQGPTGEKGADGFTPTIAVAETSDGSYKLRITNKTTSFDTPNLKGNLAPIDEVLPNSASPVQSSALKTEFDKKQDKTLATAVGVRDYTTKNIVNQTTVQTTLEALAAAVNYMEIPNQMLNRVASTDLLPSNAKPGSICFVGEDADTAIAYVCQTDGTWKILGGGSADVMVEMTSNEIDAIWDRATGEIIWTSGVALPQDFVTFGACVYNGKINILGGYSNLLYANNGEAKIGNAKYHYQLNNGQWESVSTLPKDFSGECVVYNDKIYCIGGDRNNMFISWDGNSWQEEESLPYYFKYGCAVVYDDTIHILGGSYAQNPNNIDSRTAHFKWDGTSWTEVSTLPYEFNEGSAIVMSDGIHIVGGYNRTSNNHYVWNGTSWIKKADSVGQTDSPLVIYNEKLNLLKGYRYEYDAENDSWTQKENTYYQGTKLSEAVVLNGHIHIMGGLHAYRGHSILQ